MNGDPTTYYASYGTRWTPAYSSVDAYDYGSVQFQEPATYDIFGNFSMTDPSLYVGNPNRGYVWTSDEKGTVTPVLIWTPDSATDTDPPPLTVTAQESAVAVAYDWPYIDYGQPPNDLSADDGLGNAAVRVDEAYSTNHSVVSQGARMVTADTGGSTTVTLPPVTLSASGGTSGFSIPTWINLGVMIFDTISASSTAGTVDSNHPRWFSGTACTVHASANPAYLAYNGLGYANPVTAPVYLRSATVRINGQIVRSYPEDYKVSSTDTGARLDVMFDSTHFSNGTPIKIEVECHDSLGRSYTTHLTAPAYNKALVLGNNTFGDNAQASVNGVSAAAALSNHVVVSSLQDDKTAILNELPQYTMFYIDTHGGVGNIGDCFATGGDDPGSDHTIGIVEVSTALKPKVPSYPPYNFAMFDACIVMGDKFDNPNQPDDAGLSSSFGLPTYGPAGDLTYGAGTDRAALGWDWYTISNDANAQWTKRLWDYLAEGTPLRQATTLSSAEGKAQGAAFKIGNVYGGHTSLNPIIQGDPNMTLHGVYGGTVTWQLMTDGFKANIPWYRPL